MNYSFNTYKVSRHSHYSRSGHITQAEPKSPKIHIDILWESSTFLPEAAKLPECRMSLKILKATFPNLVAETMSANRKILLKEGRRAESWREISQGPENEASSQEEQRPAEAETFGNLESPVPPLMPISAN